MEKNGIYIQANASALHTLTCARTQSHAAEVNNIMADRRAMEAMCNSNVQWPIYLVGKDDVLIGGIRVRGDGTGSLAL